MNTLILVRNGETDWNKVNRIQGTVDIPLNGQGKIDAAKIADDLSKIKIDAIYSSELSRSYETAEIIGEGHNLKPQKIKELNEFNQGLWQGLCLDDIKKRYKKQYAVWKSSPFSSKPPKGESMKEAYDKVVKFVEKLLEKHKDNIICIVSHEIVIALIKYHFKKDCEKNIWDITPKPGAWEIVEINT